MLRKYRSKYIKYFGWMYVHKSSYISGLVANSLRVGSNNIHLVYKPMEAVLINMLFIHTFIYYNEVLIITDTADVSNKLVVRYQHTQLLFYWVIS